MKPILFNTENVRSILEGRKTVTRRVMKPANPIKSARMGNYSQGNGLWVDGYSEDDQCEGYIKDYSVSDCWFRKDIYINKYAPYKAGKILYVRETWSFLSANECGSFCVGPCEGEFNGEFGCFVYRTDYGKTEDDTFPPSMFRWHPSIHMPKEAARIFLRVNDVRVERLQDITPDQARAEGAIPNEWDSANEAYGYVKSKYIRAFNALWDTTIKPADLPRYGWGANPWVWAVEFERCEKPEATS